MGKTQWDANAGLQNPGDVGRCPRLGGGCPISMILDGSDKQAQVPDGDLDEKGYWFDNLNKMLPNHLDGGEVVACLFNMASNYIPAEDMGHAFYSMSRMIEERKKTNGNMH